MTDSRRHFVWGGLLVAAVGVAAGVLWFLRDTDTARERASGAVVTRGPDVAPSKPELIEPIVPERRPPPPPPEAPRTGTVVGRVVTPGSLAQAGAHVEAWRGAAEGVPGLFELTRLRKEAVTDGEGRFTLADVPVVGDLVLHIDGECAPTELGPFQVPAGATLDLGDLVVRPGMLIVGQVRDEAGRAVAGARIGLLQGVVESEPDGGLSVPSRIVLSDEDGHFEIPGTAPAAFNLLVSAPGFARARLADAPGLGEEPSRRDVLVTLRAAQPLSGVVLGGPGDEPLAGARVVATALDPGNDGAEVVAGADGRFTLPDLAPGLYGLVGIAKGYSRGNMTTKDVKPGAPIELRLLRQGKLSGVVIDADGRPVTAFDLQAKQHQRKLDGAVPIGPFERISSPDGSFTVEGFDAGFACVDVWAKGYALTSSECVKLGQGKEVEGLLVQLVRGATLSGLVVDDTGNPVADARVSLHLDQEPEADFLRDDPQQNPRLKATRTDADGRFRIEDLTGLTFQVEVDHPDHARLRQNGVRVEPARDNDAGTFVIWRSATVRGAALDASGRPLAGASVRLELALGPAREVTADGQGRFEFARVPPGDYSLTCFGHAPSLGEILANLKPHAETFRLAAGQVLEMNVVSGN